MKYEIPVIRNTKPKPRPDENALGFAKYFTDHMFVMEHDEGKDWDTITVPIVSAFVLCLSLIRG